MKRILDTVHGYIMVDDHFIKQIIDTQLFQRLRRVEQTSIRSVYPSARHDRFIHSLGVYHIGSLIVEHLKKEAQANKYWGETETTLGIIYDSYLAACLLHDVGHAPFSHSFERYFGQKNSLAASLVAEMKNGEFESDLNKLMEIEEPNFHEFTSAIVSVVKFKERLKRINIDTELVVRMIIGNTYRIKEETHQIQNCFISLLHGNIIDADRLDYACRDVWASGYSTSSIDLRRLISASHIKKDKDNKYVVCFESNSLNEIDGLLNVKDFQVRFVINHHTVSYDQWLLDSAARRMALKYFPNEPEDKDGELALRRIISIDSIINNVPLPNGAGTISNISDDDLVYLMKQEGNSFYLQWSSRQYTHFPLWKSRDEFYHFFKGIDRTIEIGSRRFEEIVRPILVVNGVKDEEIIITKAEFKPRVKMDSLCIMVANEVTKYTEIYPESDNRNVNKYFYYIFIPKNGNDPDEIKFRRQKLIEALKESIITLYKAPQKGEVDI